MDILPLTDEEKRTLMIFRDHYRMAEARMQMAAEQQEEYFAQLRAKRGLGPEWVVPNLLTGFVRIDVEGLDGERN